MNPYMEEEYDEEQKRKDAELSEMDDAIQEYISDHCTQEWIP